jgi:uncharacterized protein (TIGR02117 family)
MGRWLRRIAGALAVLALLVALGALLPRPLLPPGAAAGGEWQRILVLSNPIHTDIAVPITDAVRGRFAFLDADGVPVDDPAAHYLIFGRGGRAFYLETPTWADLKPLPALKGLTLDGAAMHVDIAGPIPEDHPSVQAFDVERAQFDRMLDFIRDSFTDDAGGPQLIEGHSYGVHDRFYEADGVFTALLGCNTWTARALREAGLQTGWWNPLPATLRFSLDVYN